MDHCHVYVSDSYLNFNQNGCFLPSFLQIRSIGHYCLLRQNMEPAWTFPLQPLLNRRAVCKHFCVTSSFIWPFQWLSHLQWDFSETHVGGGGGNSIFWHNFFQNGMGSKEYQSIDLAKESQFTFEDKCLPLLLPTQHISVLLVYKTISLLGTISCFLKKIKSRGRVEGSKYIDLMT